MTTPLPTQNWTKRLTSVYYAAYVLPDVLTEILNRFSASQADTAFDTVLSILDYTAASTIAQLVPAEIWQQFIEAAAIKYNSDSLLETLAAYNPDILPALQQSIERQLLTIHSELEANHDHR